MNIITTALVGIFLLVSLSACSSGVLRGAFGTAAPSGSFAALPDTVTPEQERFISDNVKPDPRVLADMHVLAQQQSNEAYRIGPSDLLSVKVFQVKEISSDVRVSEKGFITIPLLGSVRIAGLTQVQAEARLAQLLGARLLQNPQVSIFIKQFTNQRFTIEGAVGRQGIFPLKGRITFLQAIASVGGLRDDARGSEVTLFRKQGGGNRVYYIDIDLIRDGRINDPLVMNDDRIVVPRYDKQQVTIEGEVNGPGIHSFTKPTTILQTIAMSKGLTGLGAPNKVILFRRVDGVENAYGIDLTAIRQGEVRDPFVRDGDRIVVHRSNSRYWLNQVSTLLSPINLLTGFIN